MWAEDRSGDGLQTVSAAASVNGSGAWDTHRGKRSRTIGEVRFSGLAFLFAPDRRDSKNFFMKGQYSSYILLL